MLTINQCACMEHYQLEGIKTRLLFVNYSPLHKLVCLSKIAFVETILPYLRGREREGERETEREREREREREGGGGGGGGEECLTPAKPYSPG